MRPIELLLVYLLFGLGVAAALRQRQIPGAGWALPFWPLYLPALLSPVSAAEPPQAPIPRAVQELRAALEGTPGLPATLSVEAALSAVERGLLGLERRSQQIAAALAATAPLSPHEAPPELQALAEAQAQSHARLRALQSEADAELHRALLAVRELTGRVLVARFSGGPDAVAADLAALGAAVDGVAEVRDLARR